MIDLVISSSQFPTSKCLFSVYTIHISGNIFGASLIGSLTFYVCLIMKPQMGFLLYIISFMSRQFILDVCYKGIVSVISVPVGFFSIHHLF